MNLSFPSSSYSFSPSSSTFEIRLNQTPTYENKIVQIKTICPHFDRLPENQKGEIREFFRRLDLQDFEEVILRIKQLPAQNIGEALAQFEWDHPIFQDVDLDLYALNEFIFGRLNRYEISELLLYCQCQRERSTVFQMIQSNGRLDEEAFEILTAGTEVHFTNEQREQFLKQISDYPPQRTRFYLLPLDFSNPKKITDQIWLLGFELFLFDTDEEGLFQIVLPPHLIVDLYKAKFGEAISLPNLVLGASKSINNFKNPHQRDVLVPSRLFPRSTPAIADGHPAPPISFYHHDIAYHLYLECHNPHRKAWIELADFLSVERANQHKFGEATRKKMERIFLDKEFIIYSNASPEEAQEYFWSVLLLKITRKLREEKEAFLEGVVRYIYLNRRAWKQEHGIDFDDLPHYFAWAQGWPECEDLLKTLEKLYIFIKNR